MSNAAELYAELLRNPLVSKAYRDLAAYYESLGRQAESIAFREMMESRFGTTDDSDNHEE